MTPDTFTIKEHMVDVGDGHTLYVHDWGNQHSDTPFLMLHGGPGGSSSDSYKQLFDPTRHRVVFHDQRGSGRSLPYGSREHNTTAKLVDDITHIADMLSIDTFSLVGRSWGSCLALAYGIKHPDRIRSMVLGGVFTGSQREIDWIGKGMFRIFYPDAWDRYLQSVPVEYRNDPSAYHIGRMQGDDLAARKESAYAYGTLVGSIMALDDRPHTIDPETYDPEPMVTEAYYMANRCFIDQDIISQAATLDVPVWLIQGRYDMVCPPATAYELHQALPDSTLSWTQEGHRTGHETWNLMRTIISTTTNTKGDKHGKR